MARVISADLNTDSFRPNKEIINIAFSLEELIVLRIMLANIGGLTHATSRFYFEEISKELDRFGISYGSLWEIRDSMFIDGDKFVSTVPINQFKNFTLDLLARLQVHRK